jgi:hypothetical protein
MLVEPVTIQSQGSATPRPISILNDTNSELDHNTQDPAYAPQHATRRPASQARTRARRLTDSFETEFALLERWSGLRIRR